MGDFQGRILAKMGSWKEALSDLEFSAKAMDGNREFHQTIAEVYEKLGIRDVRRIRAFHSTQPDQIG